MEPRYHIYQHDLMTAACWEYCQDAQCSLPHTTDATLPACVENTEKNDDHLLHG